MRCPALLPAGRRRHFENVCGARLRWRVIQRSPVALAGDEHPVAHGDGDLRREIVERQDAVVAAAHETRLAQVVTARMLRVVPPRDDGPTELCFGIGGGEGEELGEALELVSFLLDLGDALEIVDRTIELVQLQVDLADARALDREHSGGELAAGTADILVRGLQQAFEAEIEVDQSRIDVLLAAPDPDADQYGLLQSRLEGAPSRSRLTGALGDGFDEVGVGVVAGELRLVAGDELGAVLGESRSELLLG